MSFLKNVMKIPENQDMVVVPYVDHGLRRYQEFDYTKSMQDEYSQIFALTPFSENEI